MVNGLRYVETEDKKIFVNKNKKNLLCKQENSYEEQENSYEEF